MVQESQSEVRGPYVESDIRLPEVSGTVPIIGKTRLRSYQRFSDIPPRIAGEIISKLGMPGGMMRMRALRDNPKCVIACFRRISFWINTTPYYEDHWHPIGWLTLSSYKRPTFQVFVAPLHRHRGIGKKLVQTALRAFKTYGKAVSVYPQNKGTLKFYKKAGIA